MVKQAEGIQEPRNAIGVKVEEGTGILALERETVDLLAEIVRGSA